MLTPNWGFSMPKRPLSAASGVLVLADQDAFLAQIKHESALLRRRGSRLTVLQLQAQGRPALHPLLMTQRLSDLGGWLRRHLRPTDTVVHWPNGQFGVLLLGCPPAQATGVLHRLLSAPPGRYWPDDWALDLALSGRVFDVPEAPPASNLGV